MRHEIKIYGNIVPFNRQGEGKEIDLSDLNNTLDSLTLEKGDELLYRIHTLGGDTTTAFAMYHALKRFKNEKDITLISRPDGYCASSGVILQLAADVRIGNKYLRPFVHNAWVKPEEVNKNNAITLFEALDVVDNEIAELYAEETKIPKNLALQFMNENRNLSLKECIDYGFFTELENVHVVENTMIFNSIISRNQENRKLIKNNMSDKNKEAERKNLWNQIENFFKGAGPKNKIVFTAENSELDFYELGENDIPKVGDKAQFDGKPAGESNNGEYVMQSGETYKFTGEELTEIVSKADEKLDLQAENEALKAEIENLRSQNAEKESKYSVVNQKLSTATAIIQNFKKLESGVGSGEETPRNPKPENPKPENRDLFKNLKL